ncbi:MAG: SMP-30/gluconolactonase/LRE family protein, partial [Pseudolabrys sp.]|nr:SMP-30/gluconolactonase/LRE family protein [Pseudolabrys sp.]
MTDTHSPVDWRVEVAAGVELGEHPIWDDAADCLHWVDVLGGTAHRVHAGGETSSLHLGEVLGAVGLRRHGGMIAATDQNFAFRDAHGVIDRDPIAAPVPVGMRFNDAASDPAGRFLAGIVSQSGDSLGQLIQLHTDGHIEVLL